MLLTAVYILGGFAAGYVLKSFITRIRYSEAVIEASSALEQERKKIQDKAKEREAEIE